VWSGGLPAAEAAAILTNAGLRQPEVSWTALQALHASARYQDLTDTARRRLDHLMPLLLARVGQTDAADLALPRVLHLVEATARRSTYLSLLSEHPQALSNLVRLCAASPWLSEYLTQHPILLDELLDMASLQANPDRAALREELAGMLANAEDLETQMDVLRRFHQINELRIAAADLLGGLPLMRVSDRLTELAEVIVQAVLELAYAQLLSRYGRPTYGVEGEQRPAQFAIIAYGKLAGLELGYGSDLDLIFLHDSNGQDQYTEGPQVLENGVFFARLVQRIIHLLTTRTAAGMLYEVDTRLRPSGRAGLLVTSIDGFGDYQRHHAWTWEHQALVRARPVAGDAELAEWFTAVRAAVLAQPRDPRQLRVQVREMRERMRASLDRGNAQQFDLKHGPGGITDIEFMVQYSVLRWAHAQPDLLIHTDNIRLLETLAHLSLWPQEHAQRLIEIYRTLRARIHAQNLQAQPALVPADELATERAYVTERWQRLLADEADN
jgi:glutamate-ammonia-ligase adenylyltransferase